MENVYGQPIWSFCPTISFKIFFLLLIMGMSVPGYVHMYSGAQGIRHGYWKSDSRLL